MFISNRKKLLMLLAVLPSSLYGGLVVTVQANTDWTLSASASGDDVIASMAREETIVLKTDLDIKSSTSLSYDDETDILTGPAFTFTTTDNTKSGFTVTFHDTHGGYLNSTSIENGISMADTDDSAKIALKWSCSGNAANLNGETVMNVATALDPTLPTAVTSPASVLGITDPAVPTIAQEVTCTSTLSNTSQLFGSLAAKPDGNTETYTFEANLIIGSSE